MPGKDFFLLFSQIFIYLLVLTVLLLSSVTVSLEDAGVYISKDSVSPTDTAICVADLDYLDLAVTMSDTSSATREEEEDIKVQQLKIF